MRFENKSNDKWGFVEKVVDVKNKIFNSIISNKNNALNLYIINANQGIGKTRALNEVKKEFNKTVGYGFMVIVMKFNQKVLLPLNQFYKLLVVF